MSETLLRDRVELEIGPRLVLEGEVLRPVLQSRLELGRGVLVDCLLLGRLPIARALTQDRGLDQFPILEQLQHVPRETVCVTHYPEQFARRGPPVVLGGKIPAGDVRRMLTRRQLTATDFHTLRLRDRHGTPFLVEFVGQAVDP